MCVSLNTVHKHDITVRSKISLYSVAIFQYLNIGKHTGLQTLFSSRITNPSSPPRPVNTNVGCFKLSITPVSCIVYPGGDYIECSWSGFVEKESEISNYMFGVGKAEGDDSIYPFATIGAGIRSHRATGRFMSGIGDGVH